MRAYDHAIREEALELYRSGKKKTEIAKKLGISYYTVLNWIKRYEQHGEAGLQPRYHKCGGSQKVSESLKKEALNMKSDHPKWGAEYIRMKLVKSYPEAYIPSARQLRRYFRKSGIVEEASKLPCQARGERWARSTFYRVQVDAKEQIQTGDGNYCSYLTYTDEYSGAVLDAFVFPLSIYPTGSS